MSGSKAPDTEAPDDQLWVCPACGKYNKDRDKLSKACNPVLAHIENLEIVGRGVVGWRKF